MAVVITLVEINSIEKRRKQTDIHFPNRSISSLNQVINVEPSYIFYFSSLMDLAPGCQTSKHNAISF